MRRLSENGELSKKLMGEHCWQAGEIFIVPGGLKLNLKLEES